MAGDHLVDALGHHAEIAAEALGPDEDVDIALVVLGRHAVHLGDQALEIAPQRLDRVVDEGLLAREALQGRVEVAFAERLDAGHRLLLHGDVAGDHAVDGVGHRGHVALEAFRRDDDVDVAPVVFGGHPGDGLAQI